MGISKGTGMNVLVVDDEPIARRAAAQTLQYAGYEVTTAQDGREAMDILCCGEHRLVVSDWKMPRMDGVELCRAVRSGQFARYIYFIILTGQTQPEEIVEGLRAGADDYIHKPFNPAELILRVNIGRRIIGLETRDMTIFAMAKLAESRDAETGDHLERVRGYCRVIARHLQQEPGNPYAVDDEYVDLVYQTSPLHDIGKVAIPDGILLKPGPLTADEFEIMKKHTVQGAATIEAALERYPGTPFLEMARDIALGHHERYDGRGYPHGVLGDAIPLSARIMTLADVYDALTSRRIYKEAYSHQKARDMIVERSGKRFDPVMVRAFLAHEQEFIDIREQFSETGSDVGRDKRDFPVAAII
ncbi:MAG: response regulator [Planctomycetaceae bacterium]|nr:response regulator [Planctomycetaceae bacterium]